MNRTLGRRAATAAAALAVAGGAALTVSGTASAASIQDAHRTAVIAHSPGIVVHDDHRGDRYRGTHRDDRRWDDRRGAKHFGGYGYGSDGRRYRFIGHRLYYWSHGAWRLMTAHSHGHYIGAHRR